MLARLLLDNSVRRSVSIIAVMGIAGAILGLGMTTLFPKKWAAEAVVLIGGVAGEEFRPSEPTTLVLERLRSLSFLRAALKPRGLEEYSDALDSNNGGQLVAVSVRQAEAIKVQVLDPKPQVAEAILNAIYEALRDEVDAPSRALRKLYEDQQAVIAVEAAKLSKSDNASSIASDLEALNSASRSIEVMIANLRSTRLLSPISIGSRPVFPKPAYFAALGLIIGVLVGYMITIGRHLFYSPASEP